MHKQESKGIIERKNFILKLEKIQDTYEIAKKRIGRGSFGEVYMCTHKATKQQRAVKILKKFKVENVANLIQEVELLKQLVYGNITAHIGSSKYYPTI